MDLVNLKKQLKQEIIEELKDNVAPEIPVVGRFHKVSFEQFIKDYGDCVESELKQLYEDTLVLPVRSSEDSAGHDFVITKDIHLKPGESANIVTGVRAEIAKGWVLILAPRSGLGSKFRLQLNNSIGVIDGDYFHTDNEGHIMATITNDSKEGKELILSAGDRFIQGIFVPYGITDSDKPLGKRKGGYGSSGL